MNSQSASDNNDILKYILFACIGFALWTLVDSSIRFLGEYPPQLIAFLSSASTLTALLIMSPKLGGIKKTFTMPQLKMRMLRGASIATANFMAFVTFANLDLATGYAIIFVAPVLAKLLSVVLLKEQISLKSWAISLLGFIGVLIVLRPGMIPFSIGSIAALLLGIFFALGYVLGRKIGPKNQTLLSLSIFQYGFVVLGTAIPAFHSFVVMDWFEYVVVVTTGVLTIGGSLLVATAFNNAPSAYIAPIQYTQMIWGALLGALFFAEYPDLWTIIGGGIIMIAGLLLIRFSRKETAVIKGRP